MAGRLRRALEQYYRVQGKSDAVVIEVPKGSYVPVFRPVSKQEGAGVVMPGVRQEPILALPSGPSVAVMPLLNLTGDRKQEYFTEGLAEELTSELARYQELRVIAYQSTRRWKGKKIDPRAAGQDLGVRFLVEGSIRKDAKTVKIDLHVVDTQNGQRVWGEQYCRELKADSLIALQEEIARQVAARIGSLYGIILQTLSRESRRKPPESLETYEAFLRFYHHATIMSPQTFAETLKVLEQAVTREPESGFAWSLLAFLYGQSYSLQLFSHGLPPGTGPGRGPKGGGPGTGEPDCPGCSGPCVISSAMSGSCFCRKLKLPWPSTPMLPDLSGFSAGCWRCMASGSGGWPS